ncbi:membrane protein DedA, SNARE-associated domain [Streptomyces sp. DpondAA-F4a]|nr:MULTISPECIES: DedA family protein [unclassified Streptomyces]SCE01098.1 membrane protein DedA, SNARE-associated domain [Streptomyces sp. DpondAA-F4a]
MNTLALGPSWLDPDYLLNTFGLPGLLLIVFAESGLLIGFFLPGDSLLFTTGLLVTTGDLKYPLWLVCTLVALAAIVGDQVGFLFGRKVGPSLFKRPDSRLFKQENVEKAHEFFEKYGPKSLVLARFVPVVRTFTPIIAGVSRMNYRSFITFNIIGGVLWGVGVTLLGAALGRIDFVHEHIELILILIVLISVVPIAIEFLRARSRSKKEAAAAAERGEDGNSSGDTQAFAAVDDQDPDRYDPSPYGTGRPDPYGPGPATPYNGAQGGPYGAPGRPVRRRRPDGPVRQRRVRERHAGPLRRRPARPVRQRHAGPVRQRPVRRRPARQRPVRRRPARSVRERERRAGPVRQRPAGLLRQRPVRSGPAGLLRERPGPVRQRPVRERRAGSVRQRPVRQRAGRAVRRRIRHRAVRRAAGGRPRGRPGAVRMADPALTRP